MSVASSIPCIKIPNPTASCSSPSSSSSTASTSSCFRLSGAAIKPFAVTIRSSQAEGPSRRPAAPPLREPSPPAPPTPLKPIPPSSPSSPVAPPSPPKPAAQVAPDKKNIITLEFQRQKAKELQDYFKQKKLEEADQGPFFGFIGKNEIINGRYVMTLSYTIERI
uniref:Uncharacterized protein n=1 Tax=Rhizophora mucronata TaxID=61149 RepID=A0A2P2J9J5_RHIMU